MTTAAAQMTPAQQNSLARQAILGSALKVTQQIAQGTIVPAQTPQISIQPRATGLLLGFFIEILATITNTAAAALALTPFNCANILSNITFTDLNNNQRINTSGWHLHFIDTVKAHRPFGSSMVTDSPVKYGNNYTPLAAPTPVAVSTSAVVKMVYYVPLAYGPDDLRGSVYANVNNATAQLLLTINPAALGAAGADPTLLVYTGNAAATVSSVSYTVSQVYYSQLPVAQNGAAVLPLTDLATVYELKVTTQTGLSAGQDFPYPYANFRQFQSTFAVYDNGGVLNPGTDINSWKLQAANYTNIFQVDPTIVSIWTRQAIGTDMPSGVYYFDHRKKPLVTSQYGNLELVLNPITVGANSQVLYGTEAFALTNQVANAGSLAAG